MTFFMEAESFIIVQSAPFLQLEFQLFVQLPGRPTAVYMFCIQSEYFEWSTGATHQILFHQPLMHHCPAQVCIITYLCPSQHISFSFQLCAWLLFCVYACKLDDTRIYTPQARSTGLLPIQEKNPFSLAQICTLPGVSVCSLKHSRLCSASTTVDYCHRRRIAPTYHLKYKNTNTQTSLKRALNMWPQFANTSCHD